MFFKKLEFNWIWWRLFGKKGRYCFIEEGNDIGFYLYFLMIERFERLKVFNIGIILININVIFWLCDSEYLW